MQLRGARVLVSCKLLKFQLFTKGGETCGPSSIWKVKTTALQKICFPTYQVGNGSYFLDTFLQLSLEAMIKGPAARFVEGKHGADPE